MTLTPASGFPYYISLTDNFDLKALFESEENYKKLSSLKEEETQFRYAPEKWSIKQVLGHIIDHERIMSYRALRISRKDLTPLSGYDQNFFVENGRFDERSWAELLKDYRNVRQATLSLMNSFSREQFLYQGFVWKYELPMVDILKATIGHEMHHIEVLNERYLKDKV